MTYPFVQSATDLGLRKGPILGFVVHMAEGGGTVGYLAKPNPNGVSVHYVIERAGRIVQMLRESHMHSSIRPSQIRRTDDADGFYGRTAAVSVLGSWADTTRSLGPNHATIAVEIEGFASAGPSDEAAAALVRLAEDVRTRNDLAGNLGHRDFADYKACPGKQIAWDAIGGHGKFKAEVPVLDYTHIEDQPDSGPGTVSIVGAGHSAILADGSLFPLGAGTPKHSYGLVKFKDGKWAGEFAYLIGLDCGWLLKRDVLGTYVADAKAAEKTVTVAVDGLTVAEVLV